MRVRPFFWLLLTLSCLGVLVFAAKVSIDAPALMQVQVDTPRPVPVGFTTLELRLTDPQGLPIEQAQISSNAWMTNMYMVTQQKSVKELGAGKYIAQLRLYMAGPWEISITAHAPGFAPVHENLLVQVAQPGCYLLTQARY